MPDMLLHFLKRSNWWRQKSLEREAIDLLKAKRKAEKDDKPAVITVKMEIELDDLADRLLEIETKR